MRRIKFFADGYYHLYNRGVEKRDIFLDSSDFFRFLKSLNEFTKNDEKRDGALVSIICYCLMPNHFHLIVQQKANEGVSRFMQKILTGYTMYFNKRYERSGVLFQGSFKAKHIENDQYLLYLSRYIHLNPLDLVRSNKDNDSVEELVKYKWSSLGYYFDLPPKKWTQRRVGIRMNTGS